MSQAYFVDSAVVWSNLKSHAFWSVYGERVEKYTDHFMTQIIECLIFLNYFESYY